MMRADVTRSPYGPLHAILAGAALVSVVIGFPAVKYGWAFVWKEFLYGVKIAPDVKNFALMLASTVVVFGGVAAVAWASTLFTREKRIASGLEVESPEVDRRGGLKFALRAAAPIAAVTIAISMLCSAALEKATGVKFADQPLVDFLRGGGGTLAAKSLVVLLVVVEAPLFEEPLFRGVVFRGFARSMPLWGAMILSGFVFALVHLNASTFIPLWFIGAAFAWVYWKTGTILAPMLVHFLFNLLNLCLAFLFPDM